MRRTSTLLPHMLALALACPEVQCASSPIRRMPGSRIGLRPAAAFAPPHHPWLLVQSPIEKKVMPERKGKGKGTCSVLLSNGAQSSCMDQSRRSSTRASASSLPMIPSPVSLFGFELLHHHHNHDVITASTTTTSSFLSSILTSYDEAMPAQYYQAEEGGGAAAETASAFQDQVALSDLTSDPALQAAFAASAIAVVVLFVAKAVVGQMDEAVVKVALEFDRAMKLKYPKKWGRFMSENDDGEIDGMVEAESEADRIQRIVEEMERLNREEPEFVERVMRDIERMKI